MIDGSVDAFRDDSRNLGVLARKGYSSLCAWIFCGFFSLIFLMAISTVMTYAGWSLLNEWLFHIRPFSFLELFFVGIFQVFALLIVLIAIVFGFLLLLAWVTARMVGIEDEYELC